MDNNKSYETWRQVSSWIFLVNVHGLAPGLQHLVLSPDGKKLVSGTSGAEVQMWDVETGDALASFSQSIIGFCEVITALAFSSDGALLAVGSNKRIRVMGSNNPIRLKEVPNGVDNVSICTR